MRNILAAILLVITTASFGQSSYSRYTDVVPAAGHTITFHAAGTYPPLCQVISVNTAGSAVNLGVNTYTLTYDSLPDKMAWTVYCDFSKLSFTAGSQVTLFGVRPLVDFPAADTFTINYVVLLNAGVKALWYNYVSPKVQLSGIVPGSVTFTGFVTFGDSIFYPAAPPVSGPQDRGATLTISPASGAIALGCNLTCKDSGEFWNIHGNLGLGGQKRFLGTLDTALLAFRINNVPAGFISYSNAQNVALGYQSMLSNTTGNENSVYGYQAAYSNTTGTQNTAIGAAALYGCTTSTENTVVGVSAGSSITTGSGNNTAIGGGALSTTTTGTQNTAVGTSANVSSPTTNFATAIGAGAVAGTYGIAIGAGATAGNNQLAFENVRSIYISGVVSAIGYVLTDTSGNGNFIPQAAPGNSGTTYTSVTGDSVTISTPKNTVNPAGTIANWTAILPASPVSWQVYEFSFLQAVTTVHWSIRLSGGSVSGGVPTAAAQYATIKIYYNPTLTEWVLY